VVLWVLSLATVALAAWSRRVKIRLEGSSESATHLGIKFGLLSVLLFPLAAVFALVAAALSVSSFVDSRGTRAPVVDDGCGSVELALKWFATGSPSDAKLGAAVAAEVWERSITDDAYSNALREGCPVEVLRMIDLAGLEFDP
jgi:hypothetical protein